MHGCDEKHRPMAIIGDSTTLTRHLHFDKFDWTYTCFQQVWLDIYIFSTTLTGHLHLNIVSNQNIYRQRFQILIHLNKIWKIIPIMWGKNMLQLPYLEAKNVAIYAFFSGNIFILENITSDVWLIPSPTRFLIFLWLQFNTFIRHIFVIAVRHIYQAYFYVCSSTHLLGIFLASQDALEVMLFTYWLSRWWLALTWLMWPWWVMIPKEDLTDVTLVSEDAL